MRRLLPAVLLGAVACTTWGHGPDVLARAAVDSVRVRVFSPARTVVLSAILLGCYWVLAQHASFNEGT